MKIIIKLLLAISIVSFVLSCDDFIEDRLDDKIVNIISPANESVLTSNKIIIAWDPLSEAAKYIIQVAVPSFNIASTLILDTIILATDTIVRKTSFPYSFSNGSYQCRIKANSSGSSTDFSYVSFNVITNINDIGIEIISPKDRTVIESNDVVFAWDLINGIKEYQLQVVSPSFNNISRVAIDTILNIQNGTNDAFFMHSELTDGDYEWRIRAKTPNSFSPYVYATFNVLE